MSEGFNSYQKWLERKKAEGHDPERFWDDCKFHTWLRTGPFEMLCHARGAKFETIIGKRYFLLWSYNSMVDGAWQHLITINDDGLFQTIHKCMSLQEAQMYSHKFARSSDDEQTKMLQESKNIGKRAGS